MDSLWSGLQPGMMAPPAASYLVPYPIPSHCPSGPIPVNLLTLIIQLRLTPVLNLILPRVSPSVCVIRFMEELLRAPIRNASAALCHVQQRSHSSSSSNLASPQFNLQMFNNCLQNMLQFMDKMGSMVNPLSSVWAGNVNSPRVTATSSFANFSERSGSSIPVMERGSGVIETCAKEALFCEVTRLVTTFLCQ